MKRLWLDLVRVLWPQPLHRVHILEALGRSRDQEGLGSRRPRGALHTTVPSAARALPTRTKSVFITATWTSSGSTRQNRPCPMDCPTTEEAFEARGPRGRFQGAPSPRHRSAVLAWRQMTRPVLTSALEPWMSAVIPGEQKKQMRKRKGRSVGLAEAGIKDRSESRTDKARRP